MYKNKYLKYKRKYLDLKLNMQTGGEGEDLVEFLTNIEYNISLDANLFTMNKSEREILIKNKPSFLSENGYHPLGPLVIDSPKDQVDEMKENVENYNINYNKYKQLHKKYIIAKKVVTGNYFYSKDIPGDIRDEKKEQKEIYGKYDFTESERNRIYQHMREEEILNKHKEYITIGNKMLKLLDESWSNILRLKSELERIMVSKYYFKESSNVSDPIGFYAAKFYCVKTSTLDDESKKMLKIMKDLVKNKKPYGINLMGDKVNIPAVTECEEQQVAEDLTQLEAASPRPRSNAFSGH